MTKQRLSLAPLRKAVTAVNPDNARGLQIIEEAEEALSGQELPEQFVVAMSVLLNEYQRYVELGVAIEMITHNIANSNYSLRMDNDLAKIELSALCEQIPDPSPAQQSLLDELEKRLQRMGVDAQNIAQVIIDTRKRPRLQEILGDNG